MGDNWVFFEPVNFAGTVYDTDNLSDIRGASYALIKGPAAFRKRLNPIDSCEFSSSLLCKTDMDEDAIKAAFFAFLNDPNTGDADLDATLKTMCFSFGVYPCSGEDASFKEEYITLRNRCQKNRFKLQSARLHGPERAELGKPKNRGAYYRAIDVEMENEPEFPQTFKDIISSTPKGYPHKFKNKICVLEFDADKLGEKLPLTSFTDFKAASQKQNDLMTELVNAVFEASVNKANKLELETLLFAGDEGIFIFPVWKLQEIMGIIEAHLNGENAFGSFSCGLVICGQKTPILRVRRLTHALVRECKGLQAEKSTLQYIVAGDMDVPDGDLKDYRKRIFDFEPSVQNEIFPIELSAFDGVLTRLREVQKRTDEGGAPASHSKVKSAITVLREKKDLARAFENLKMAEERLDNYSLPEKKAVAEPLNALAEPPSALVGGQSDYQYYFASLLHAAALGPFLVDGTSLEEGSDA